MQSDLRASSSDSMYEMSLLCNLSKVVLGKKRIEAQKTTDIYLVMHVCCNCDHSSHVTETEGEIRLGWFISRPILVLQVLLFSSEAFPIVHMPSLTLTCVYTCQVTQVTQAA